MNYSFSNFISVHFRTCQTPSWQLPRPDADLPRMSSDVGASRIWNRLLDAAFDNSDRRKHGMGFVGRMGKIFNLFHKMYG